MQTSKLEAIKIMNNLGGSKTPFLFLIDFRCNVPIVIKLDDDIDSNELLFDFNGISNCDKIKASINKKINFVKHPISYELYLRAFNRIEKNIRDGNTYLLNLTFPTKIETNLSLREIFFISKAKYKLVYKNSFVFFSPEPFVKIKDGLIRAFPMKGTIDANIKNAEEIILNDEKEKAEHITIVDLMRNDLSIVSKNVCVEKFRYIEKISTNNKELLQVSSVIKGELPDNYCNIIGDIIFSLLPAGSISGAPKTKTLEIILESEQYERGYYTGVCGYFNGSELDSGVMIRFIENIDNTLYYKSGGGITYMSDAKSEFNELIDKVYVPLD